MEYKYKQGDLVRIKPEVDLDRLGISGDKALRKLRTEVQTITDATPGRECWCTPDLDNTPTYSIDGWRLPESYLTLVETGGKECLN